MLTDAHTHKYTDLTGLTSSLASIIERKMLQRGLVNAWKRDCLQIPTGFLPHSRSILSRLVRGSDKWGVNIVSYLQLTAVRALIKSNCECWSHMFIMRQRGKTMLSIAKELWSEMILTERQWSLGTEVDILNIYLYIQASQYIFNLDVIFRKQKFVKCMFWTGHCRDV